ncbi:hypothetical protein [Mesobacillus zeae]|uniref:Uncharacterized protein n=1 Tax=Mesobacillus zeae TaxID=1917180 RepID=A0A398AVQ0_9BACI|nr:hypothetical protein [Mesobacillus zeae]RID81682.1 hypothetical protein D1970_21095 [Mesobacillus zeae]
MFQDACKRQKLLRGDFEFILGEMAGMEGLTSRQKLYLLSLRGRKYLTGRFQTTLMPTEYIDEKASEEIMSTLRERKVDMVETYSFKYAG